MNNFRYIARWGRGAFWCADDLEYVCRKAEEMGAINYELYVRDENGERKIEKPIIHTRKSTLEEKIVDMCYKNDDLEKVIATKDMEIEQLNNELLQLKSECYKKRNDNKSLRGTLKATLETSNNRHNEIKRLLEKIEKLELKHKQLKDLDKTQVAISKLLKEKEELKKWLSICLDEEEQKTLSSISSGYEMGIITTLRSVIAKVEELEKGVNND